MFWHDKWANRSLKESIPELFSYAKDKLITVKGAMSQGDFTNLFQLPLSQIAFEQMQNVQQLVETFPQSEENDKWSYSWGSGIFHSSMVYRVLVGHSVIHPTYKWLWKSNCQPKHKVFFWLLIKDRLSTRNILKRRNMQLGTYSCALCNSLTEETVEHLFADCAFAAMCWDLIGVMLPQNGSFPELTSQIKDQLNSRFFMDAIILMCWTIWSARNDLIFRGMQRSQDDCASFFFLQELSLLKFRVKANLEDQFTSWIQNLL